MTLGRTQGAKVSVSSPFCESLIVFGSLTWMEWVVAGRGGRGAECRP